ncbi:hypothetical protein BKP35_05455 [Anaerobacillus arseniciselenatis]|uniref:ADP-ribosyl cyclase/cyclic ADP-ribose hydrolase n=1 Tax=Anaerobacillus arseniciselenatis TaxID=85682 RepID=A0A1S2LQU1_9BACI|nr:TIR domain-containing protein [Anaerobacillus arseniciselenatis]OIJ14882.1 hypothetical protein BKP35_05455 [Anaerobacillus arseniciselenatis]
MPSVSILEFKIKNLRSDINRLEGKRANAIKDESNSIKKINNANTSLNRTKSVAAISSKLKELERENRKIEKAKGEQAKIMSEISKKSTQLNKALADLGKAQQKEVEKVNAQQEEKINKLYSQQKFELEKLSFLPSDESIEYKEYDVFISHSADDKDSYVSELAEALKAAGVTIWYDTDNIGWGKSIREEIDKGLAYSKYGIVIISPSFIEKYWTNYELDGILNKESTTRTQMILPIWHNVTADEVKKYSYSLAGKLALNTAVNTIDDIVDKVNALIK